MSQECKCEPKSRFMLWLAIYMLFMQSCMGCADKDIRQDNAIRSLQSDVSMLQLKCK